MRIFGYVVLIVIALVLFSLIGSVLGWFGQAKQVAEQEFSPRALFDRYQWFKDAAAQLDKKRADISVYNQRIKAMDTDYIGTVSYTHLRAHETPEHLVCRLL